MIASPSAVAALRRAVVVARGRGGIFFRSRGGGILHRRSSLQSGSDGHRRMHDCYDSWG